MPPRSRVRSGARTPGARRPASRMPVAQPPTEVRGSSTRREYTSGSPHPARAGTARLPSGSLPRAEIQGRVRVALFARLTTRRSLTCGYGTLAPALPSPAATLYLPRSTKGRRSNPMETVITGKAYVLGDNIDTDQIIPAQYL